MIFVLLLSLSFHYYLRFGRRQGQRENARDFMLKRFDGECWEHDASYTAVTDVKQTEAFGNRDAWMKYNQEGYDTEVRFAVGDNKITVITENAGVSLRNTAVLSDMSQPIYAAITGDQVAVTNIRVKHAR